LNGNQNPSCFKELEHLKQQTTMVINRIVLVAAVNANILIATVIFS